MTDNNMANIRMRHITGLICLKFLLINLALAIVIYLVVTDTDKSNDHLHSAQKGGHHVHMKPWTHLNEPTKPTIEKFHRAAVVVENQKCAQIGNQILRVNGGSAVDAAIAILLCIGVVSPHYSGIGGGFIMTVYDKPRGGTVREIKTLNARGVAPGAAHRDMFLKVPGEVKKSPRRGPFSIMIPGEVYGMYSAWQRYGRLPWNYLFQPAIKLAEESTVNRLLAKYSASNKEHLMNFTVIREQFVKPNGETYQEGDIIKMPTLARTLRRLASQGGESFYKGALARDIVRDLREQGSIITASDLRKYKVDWKDPVKVHLSSCNCTVYGPSPPSSAIIVLFILNVLDGYNMSKDTPSSLIYHRLIEATKFGYAKRSEVADEDFVDVTKFKRELLSEELAAETRKKIDDKRTFGTSHYEPKYDIKEDSGTSHISVLAADGSAVSVTTSIDLHFGSKIMGRRTGIIFNDIMDDFSNPGFYNTYGFASSPSNYIEPGKSPMSSKSPVIVVDHAGVVRMMTGAAGGARIVSAVSQNLFNRLILKKEPFASIGYPRLHHQLVPDTLFYEQGFPKRTLDALRAKGHTPTLREPNRWFGGAMSIINSCDLPCKDEGEDSQTLRFSPIDRSRPKTCELFCLHVVKDRRSGEDARSSSNPVYYY